MSSLFFPRLFLIALGCLLAEIQTAWLLGAATIHETFASDPVAAGRFFQETSSTETTFLFNLPQQNLSAVLDVDSASAYYLSSAFPAVTDQNDASFSVIFRVGSIDDRVPPTSFIGLVTPQHIENFGDGLTVNLSTSLGQLVATASIDDFGVKAEGSAISLEPQTAYLAYGRYSAATRELTVDIYTDLNFVRRIGRSVARLAAGRALALTNLGIQNGGARVNDSEVGSISMIVDDLATPGLAPVNLTIADISVNEGTGASVNAQFTVRLSQAAEVPVTVNYQTVNGSAEADQDFMAANALLTIPTGTTSATIAVPIIADALGETNETFRLLLSNAVNVNLANTEAKGTIVDDDRPNLVAADTTVTEGQNGIVNALVLLTLSNPSSLTVTVRYATAAGSASLGVDYVTTNGVITFPPGATAQTIAVGIRGDLLVEGDETVLVNLSDPVNVALPDPRAQITILNDDPIPSISIGDQTTTEGDAGPRNLALTVRLSGPSAQAVSIDYASADDTAKAGADYLAKNGTLTFGPGETEKTIAVTILGDTLNEGDEAFQVNFSNASNATLLNNKATGTIADDDQHISLFIDDAVVLEGAPGQTTDLRFNVRLQPAWSQTVTVNYATYGGSAAAGNDFVSTSGLLTFQPNQTLQTITVSITGDNANEGNETFVVQLSNALNAVLADAEATGTIINDDGITLHVSDAAVVEGDGTDVQAVFTVTLTGTPTKPVTVNYATANRTAVAAEDYVAQNGILRFQLGQTLQTISVPVRGDLLDEPEEQFELNLSAPVEATLSDARGIATITDNDPPSISIDHVQVTEGNSGLTTARFNARLSSPTFE
ncbi:MAG: hypothetical protein L0Z50_20985, partial [Verrucomicrobiales bacterium]|nr:hypothetical protein [Verrucomicrobiales bacterium]